LANVIKIKQSSVAANVPTPGQLAQGELAINTADRKVFSKDSSNAIWTISSSSFSLKTSAYTAVAGDRIAADTSGGSFTITLPVSAVAGDIIEIIDNNGDLAVNSLTIGRNSHNVDSIAEDVLVNKSNAHFWLQYVDVSVGWDVFGVMSTSAGGGMAGVVDLDGITFPATQVASADANTLDDYEEGTWTPTITDGTNSATVYSNQYGSYTKIGDTVQCQGRIHVSNLGSVSGAVYIGGLPFAGSSTTNNYGVTIISYYAGMALVAAGRNITGAIVPSESRCKLYLHDGTGGVSSLLATEFTATGDLIFATQYKV